MLRAARHSFITVNSQTIPVPNILLGTLPINMTSVSILKSTVYGIGVGNCEIYEKISSDCVNDTKSGCIRV